MTITFRNKHPKNPRIDKKTTPMRSRIEQFCEKNQDMFQGNYRLQLSQIKRVERELLSNYSIEMITDEILLNYFKLKLYFPRTPYIKKLINQAIAITKKLDIDNDELVDAEDLYKCIINISEFADSTIYAWFKSLNAEFTTTGIYHVNTIVMIVYLALVKGVKNAKKLKAS
ncbi:hypothetical protein [Dolichospermum phage Dfl-JY23]